MMYNVNRGIVTNPYQPTYKNNNVYYNNYVPNNYIFDQTTPEVLNANRVSSLYPSPVLDSSGPSYQEVMQYNEHPSIQTVQYSQIAQPSFQKVQ